MPNYTIRNNLTGDASTMSMSIVEMEELLKNHSWLSWVPEGATPQLDPIRMGRKKPDDGFRDILRQVKKKNPGSKINTF